MHEAKLHHYNTWLTATYDDDHLPSRYYTGLIHPVTGKKIYSGTLLKIHAQKFLRALRKKIRSRNASAFLHAPPAHLLGKKSIRYYYGGEYGEKYKRPHYHFCIFGLEMADRKHIDTTDTGFALYHSPELTKLWEHGTIIIGDLNWQTAAYTARYIMKKITGAKQKEHYTKICAETGEIIHLLPEYNDMSRMPGLGQYWLKKFQTDVYPHDHVIVRGKRTRPPRYYDKLYEKTHPDELEQLRFERSLKAKEHHLDHTEERLRTAEIVQERRIQSLKQKL